MTWPAVVLWALIAWATFSRGPLIVYLFSVSAILGSLTMLPPGIAVGQNIPAQLVCCTVFLAKFFSRSDNRDAALRLALDFRKLGSLTVFWVYAMLSSFIFPVIFAGSVLVTPLYGAWRGVQPLVVSSNNFTQAFYLSVSLSTLLAFAVAARGERFRRHFFNSVLLAGVLMGMAGLADLICSSIGQSALLTPFRNANYALLVAAEIAGQKRVVGLMPEASAFGALCCEFLAFLVFCPSAFVPIFRRRFVPICILLLLVMTVLSTSTTGYAGLLALAALFSGRAIQQAILTSEEGSRQIRPALFILLGLVITGLVWIVEPTAFASALDLINAVVLQKDQTYSYSQRSEWTRSAIDAFWGTYGVGVGVGSVRTSNWFANLLSSTGILGGLLLATAIFIILRPRKSALEVAQRELIFGLKLTLIPAAVMLSLSGTTPDPGIWPMSLLGVLYALSYLTLPTENAAAALGRAQRVVILPSL